jgi:hypothetical protein
MRYDDYFFAVKCERGKLRVRKRTMKHSYRAYLQIYEEFMRNPTANKWGLLRLWIADIVRYAPQFEPPVDAVAVAILRRYI